MSGIRPWHIVLLAVSILALGVSLYFSLSREDEVAFADSIILVDLESGDLIEAALPKKKAVSPPAANPETKRRSLFPAVEADGKWFVNKRYLAYVKEFVPSPEAVLIDAKSGEVKVQNAKPRRADVVW
ncbi:MAG: hypothetical protein HBSAPP03_25360 [Phycisphaerae bacterium]|nr:MAG: hypothetical protein HBSAPP03_25360 [Phycisphaerae bacterium]